MFQRLAGWQKYLKKIVVGVIKIGNQMGAKTKNKKRKRKEKRKMNEGKEDEGEKKERKRNKYRGGTSDATTSSSFIESHCL